MTIVIKVENLLFDYFRLKQNNNSLKKYLFFRENRSLYTRKQAIRGISFEIEQGSTVGILGTNGSGKSTLLKLLAGLYPPSAGRIQTWGSVAPLMDLGVGFHPELTARENINLNSVLLGQNQNSIHEILEWANLELETDSPVRTFSSGMLARLAFSIAIHGNPDILLIDEVLSVGDESFQRKSINRMKGLINSNKTVVLVSHNLELLASQCERIIWLQNGLIIADGDPVRIISEYRNSIV